jgi:hypothetical protein
MADLQPLVTAFHRKSIGRAVNPAFVDFVGAFKADPALLDEAKAELARLDELDSSLHGNLHQRDFDQGIRRVALRGMLTQFNQTDAK